MAQSSWLELYRAALLEIRHEVLQNRIHDAEAAIRQRRQQLEEDLSAESLEEQITLDDALHSLRILSEIEDVERRDRALPAEAKPWSKPTPDRG
jgi:hypothetical protein